MNNTLKSLSTLITKEYAHKSLEELAAVYAEDQNPSAFAAAFKAVFNLANYIASGYYGLASDDIASFTLETLDSCLMKYDPQKGSFSTIFTTMLKNRLRTETQALNMQKRKSCLNSNSLDDLMEATNFDIETEDELSPEMIMLILDSYGLTAKEEEYCKLIMMGHINSDISKILGVSVMTLSNMRKRLQIKLAPLGL